MGEHSSSLASLGLDSSAGLALDSGQLLQDAATKRKLAGSGPLAQVLKRRQCPSGPSEPIVDTPPTPAGLPDGPDFWSGGGGGGGGGAGSSDGAVGAVPRPQLARQLGHGLRAGLAGGGGGVQGQRQARAAAAAIGWRSAPQRSFPPSGDSLQVQEISSELWQEPELVQQLRTSSLESCGALPAAGVVVQEVETDPESVPGSPRSSPGTPERPRAQHGLSIVELHYAEEEEHQEHWEQESSTTEELVVLPERAVGTTALRPGGDEPALFTLRPLRRLMHPVRRCLSPMAEESCEELDWSEPRARTARQREDEEEDEEREEESSSSSGTLHVREDAEESVRSESVSADSRVREEERMETSNESSTVETRAKGRMDTIEELCETRSVESRVRCDRSGEKVNAGSLPAVSGEEKEMDCDISFSESLPVESRVRPGGARKRLENGLSEESVASSDDSVKNDSRSAGTEDATESSQSSSRSTQHRTSWSLPSEAVKTDFRTLYIPRTSVSSSNGSRAAETNSSSVVNRVSWSLPNEARIRNGNGTNESAAKEQSKKDPDHNVTTTVSSSLPNVAISREARQRKSTVLSGSVPNEARLKEEEKSKELEKGGDKAENRSQTSSSTDAKDESKVEIIDRTNDKKYNFSALRMKRKQAQLAAKDKKEGKTKSNTTNQSKRPSKSSTAKEKPAASESRDENPETGSSRLMPDSAEGDEGRDSQKCSEPAKTGKSEKAKDAPSTATKSKTSQEIIEDLESDTSWRTIRPTDPKENNSGQRLEPPSVLTPLTDLECYVTETLMLSAEVTGQPCPEARWVSKPFLSSQQEESLSTLKEGQTVKTDDHHLIQRQGPHRHRLVLPRLSYKDAGRYTVVFTNSQGEAASHCKVVVRPLTELRAPHFFTPLVPRTVCAGDKAQFSCEVRGSPLPSVTWFKDSVALRAGPEVLMTYKLTTGLCSLTLVKVQVGDGGQYTCRASNQHGHTQIQTTLQVIENEQCDSTEAKSQDTAGRVSAEATSIDTQDTSSTKTAAGGISRSTENGNLDEAKSPPVINLAPSDATSPQNMTHKAQDTIPNGLAQPSGAVIHSKEQMVAPTTQSSSGGGSVTNTSTRGEQPSSSGVSSRPTGEVAPPSAQAGKAQQMAPQGTAPGSSEERKTLSPASDISSSQTVQSSTNASNNDVQVPGITSSSSAKASVVINHPIKVAPSSENLPEKTLTTETPGKTSFKNTSNVKSTSLHEKTPGVASSKNVSSVDNSTQNATINESSSVKDRQRTVEALKISTEQAGDVRSHPVELTLPDVGRSHPIQVPCQVALSHPIESDSPVRTTKAGRESCKRAPQNSDRLKGPPEEKDPPPEEEEREPTDPPPPAADRPDHQLTAPGASGAATDATDAPPPTAAPELGRAPEDAPDVGRGLRRTGESSLSKPPPVISWRNDARPVPRSAPVRVMTSPEAEVTMDATEVAPEAVAESAPEAAPETEVTNEPTVASEEPAIAETAQPAAEPAAEETPATEEPVSPPPKEEVPEPAAEPVVAEEPPVPEEPPASDPPSVQPPSVEEALAPVQAVAGCPGRLEGRISGVPKPTVAWSRNGVTLHPDGERVRQYHHDDGTFGLEIAESREEDVGTYAATAVNSAGQAATEAAFQLLDTSTAGKEWAPDFTTPLLGAKVDEGGAIELDTHITGVPIPEITWTKNGVPIEAGPRVTLGYDSDKATLSIKPAETSDAGKYEITIKNKLGEKSSAVKVKINKIYTVPQFAEKLMDVQQIPGLDAKFACRVTALPKPEVQWLFNDQPLKSSKKHKIRREEDACTLSVRECAEGDAGTYTCRATNSEGTVSSSADLRVVDKLDRKPKLEAPLFLKSIGDCEVFPGMQARFTGCVAGNPEPECEWYRNDVRIYPSDRIVVENDGSGLVRLTLRTVDETDAGRYRLRIRNSEGEAACEADLTYDSFENTPTKPLKDQYQTLERQLKSGIPMPLADPPIVSRMSDRQLTLSWKPSPAAGQHIPPTYTVEMAKMPEGGFAVVHTGVRGCSVEIKRLEPQCDYKFRVIVENKHGASEPSPHTVAHRVGLVPSPPPENPTLPDGDTFRADSSPLFPRGFDMEKHTNGKGHPPTFLRQESNMQYGVKGRDAKLRWYIFGFPKPDFSFTFNNVTIEMTGRYSCSYNNAGELTLVINSMQERDQGVYEALCTSKYGEARQKVILRMSEPPRFLQHPEETTVMQREQARFEARVTGVPMPQIQWYKDWKPLKSDKRVRILWREPDTCILLVNGCLIPRDGGLYSVSATTPAGTTSASAMLHVEFDDAMYNYISYSPARSIKPRNKPFEDFCDIGEELGRGTQAATYHVIQRSNGCSFAAKAMNGKGEHRLSMNSEMWIMNQLHDRQLARLYDAYESPRQLILVQELCSGGEVLEALCREPTYNESDVASVIRQVLWGLQSMHLKHIAHLGLTPGDILFSRPNGDEVKLIDFSLARHINPEKPERLDYGMPEFVAPEAVNGESVGLPADIWSVGVITYLLLSGTSPFRGETDRDTLKRIQSGEMQYDLEVFAEISDEAKDFIAKLLVFPAAGRPDVKTALRHPWLAFADRTPTSVKDRSTDRLKLYLDKFRAWYRNASCQTWFRRRPLSSAFEHPSEMVYPSDVAYTPPPSPEPLRKEKWAPPRLEDAAEEEELDGEPPLDDQLEWIGAESHYQQGPDTYLLQLRDTGLPSRLRQYIKVAADRSPTFAQRALDEPMYDRTLPVLHERRRFTDIMDEEIDDERRSRIDKYSAEQGHYMPRRLRYELSARPRALAEADAVREQKRQGQFPYFREKPFDMAIQEGQAAELSCLAVGNPKPIVQWFRNDVVIGETRRIKILEEAATGRSILRLQPAMDFDQGVYKVICRNNVGQTVAKCRLYLGYDPGTCDLPDVADYTDTEVLLRWKVPTDTGYSPILAYGLQAKQLIEHQWTDIAENIGHEFYLVKDLKPESNYHFRLKARNKLGWGPYSVPTPTVRTRGAGWPKRLELGKLESLLMQMTELGQEPADLEARPDLDYEAEQSPVTLTEGSPEQAYTFLAEIHRGRFSLVAACVHTMSGTIRAAKLIEAGSEDSLEQALAEFESLRSLRHERVAALYDAYRMDTKLVLVMEKLLGQDVLSFFQAQHNYSEEMVATVVTQMLDGLQYLHWRGVAHLDLQPDNVVLTSSRRLSVKLVDLGSAQRVSKLGKMVRAGGHLDFTAPELLVDEPAFPQTDIWSLGAIAYLLLSGQAPFLGDTEDETRQNTLYVRFRFEYLHKEITNEATRFLMTLFRRAPSKRPTCDQCLEHRWLMSIEYMQKRRERAIFLGNRLKDYSNSYHQSRQRQATQNTDLIAAFTMDLLTI
ncbi:obscurin-like isoform X2 [Amphibalanus amphitrite]|uniref:obscurin-like isoform X2 n=1 Tax=Amphibalanus amphitrite TaxID=1232801 RepID=UPI001C90EDBE|nr:obscurin-like isoform X2 [Amphibalanus amphitrite]